MPHIRPDLVTLDHLLLPKHFFTIENLREAVNYQPTEEDIFVATYPKCGTTWMQYIIWEILNNGKDPPYVHEMWYDYCRHLEQTGTKDSANLSKPRTLKIHLPFNYAPYNNKGKYILIVRNPWDTCISYFNHIKSSPSTFGFEEGTLDDFIECFLEGYTPWGCYFKHVASWLRESSKPNILVLTYEEMKRDIKSVICKVAAFIGEEYEEKLNDPNLLDRIVKHTSFDSMKKLPLVTPLSREVAVSMGLSVGKNIDLVQTGNYKYKDFFKVGEVGYGYHRFHEQQRRAMISKIREELSSFSSLIKTWKDCGIVVE